VNNTEDLFENVKNVHPSETMLRCFNIICPYEKQLPKNMDRLIQNFFGASDWYKGGTYTSQKEFDKDKN